MLCRTDTARDHRNGPDHRKPRVLVLRFCPGPTPEDEPETRAIHRLKEPGGEVLGRTLRSTRLCLLHSLSSSSPFSCLPVPEKNVGCQVWGQSTQLSSLALAWVDILSSAQSMSQGCDPLSPLCARARAGFPPQLPLSASVLVTWRPVDPAMLVCLCVPAFLHRMSAQAGRVEAWHTHTHVVCAWLGRSCRTSCARVGVPRPALELPSRLGLGAHR
ncbi:uncharacterized protein B0I36DRAFT_162484 [Microdochium trichocladiopsis]|uniref:Uncharacterized protein n=1 Tax=Microdochium trichocladiopsis TaxID=1682393 RepID=A0A9P8XYM4_9PEZI|nr:uncharacterized protein B0I36DRAFT_162484 [Microdochium trichocladiopsis]KAH7024495.1 hypothetical protein B0I36DRAFT_162484 [Microdochium trichocladiopsis]